MKAYFKWVSVLLAGALCLAAGTALLALIRADSASASPLLEREPFTDHSCLECHADQPRLTDLSTVEETEAESLSSGPG